MARGPQPAPPRRFFLAVTPAEGEPALAATDQEHARRVLRLGTGDSLIGIDGRGGAWPLRVRSTARGRLALEPDGPPSFEPAPGEAGAPLPWIELATVLPRARRAEDMLDRLVQLGLAALTPLVTARTQGAARELSKSRLVRLDRTAREACKQSGRAWMPVVHEPTTPGELATLRRHGALALLAPRAPLRLIDWAAEIQGLQVGTAERPIVLVVGPEGGWTEEERAALAAVATPATLGPHVLRIETAAEAALASAAQVLGRRTP